MLGWLSPIVYVQISPERVVIRNVQTQAVVSEVPDVAIAREPKPRIVAVGAEAAKYKNAPNTIVVNPFAHPRSMVSDFTVAEQLLKTLLRRLFKAQFLLPSPKVVMHPLGNPQGGFTQVEFRAFREMAVGAASASRVALWEGRALTDQELLNGSFADEMFRPSASSAR